MAALEAVATVRRNLGDVPLDTAALIAAARDCDVIIADRQTEGGGTVFRSLPKLVAFARCAVDIRNIEVAAASQAGILVTQASAGFMASVAEWIIGVMIDLSRHISQANAAYHAGEAPPLQMGRELRGATIGIIGYGRIGRCLSGLAAAFGMRVLVTDPYARIEEQAVVRVPLQELLAEADHVVCLAHASAETENLMNASAFAAMKPGALFINASRGNLVDEGALLEALDTGRIGGCALDVGRAPDQMPSPLLARHPRVIATPHIGGLTPPAIEHQALETVSQVAEILAGRVPPGAVNGAFARRLGGFGSAGA
ncbi:MAG: hydroxyacid dehydrogenase [Lautropia sp.]|nr:hydroxyacid dehydrogenase [Lautropia sp.]